MNDYRSRLTVTDFLEHQWFKRAPAVKALDVAADFLAERKPAAFASVADDHEAAGGEKQLGPLPRFAARGAARFAELQEEYERKLREGDGEAKVFEDLLDENGLLGVLETLQKKNITRVTDLVDFTVGKKRSDVQMELNNQMLPSPELRQVDSRQAAALMRLARTESDKRQQRR